MGKRRRVIIKVAGILLAGAIINVAVAWAIALTLDPMRASEAERGVDLTEKGDWEVFSFGRFGTEYVHTYLNQGRVAACELSVHEALPTWCRSVVQMPIDTILRLDGGPTYQARGWPLVTFWGQLESDRGENIIRGSLDVGLPAFQGSPRIVPITPIWPGFAINTICYAAILYALVAVPGAVRRRIRIKRGQCASCGYSLRGSVGTVCPECGATA